jgi:hypothetical protein
MAARARRSDPKTSHDAAASVRNLSEAQDWLLEFIRKIGPVTDQHIWEVSRGKYTDLKTLELVSISQSGMRTRRKELVEMGLIQDSGLRKRLRSGREAIMWEVAPTGPTDRVGTRKLF